MILIRSAHPGIMSRNLSAALAKSPQQPFHELSNSRAVKQWCTQKGGITDINSCKRLKQRVSMCESLDVQSAHTLKHSDGDPYHRPPWLFEQHYYYCYCQNIIKVSLSRKNFKNTVHQSTLQNNNKKLS